MLPMDEQTFRQEYLTQLEALPKVRDRKTYRGPRARGGPALKRPSGPGATKFRPTKASSAVISAPKTNDERAVGGASGDKADATTGEIESAGTIAASASENKGETYWSALGKQVADIVGPKKARLIMLEMQRRHLKYVDSLSMDEIEMMAGG